MALPDAALAFGKHCHLYGTLAAVRLRHCADPDERPGLGVDVGLVAGLPGPPVNPDDDGMALAVGGVRRRRAGSDRRRSASG